MKRTIILPAETWTLTWTLLGKRWVSSFSRDRPKGKRWLKGFTVPSFGRSIHGRPRTSP